MAQDKPVVGLALGSGAARGFAHLGVLQVFEAAGIPIDIIAGTSIGSLVGGLYAHTPDIDETTRKVLHFIRSPHFRRTRLAALRARHDDEGAGWLENVSSLFKKGYTYSTGVWRRSIFAEEDFEHSIAMLMPDVEISDLTLPFAAVATEITEGREFVFREGSLRQAIVASSSIPGLFPPVEVDGRILVDGGSVNPIPVSVARELGAEFVIAIDISTDMETIDEFKRGYNIYLRTLDIARRKLQRVQLDDADVVIHPDVNSIHWADFGKFRKGIALGRAAAQKALPTIQEALRQKSSRFVLFRRSA